MEAVIGQRAATTAPCRAKKNEAGLRHIYGPIIDIFSSAYVLKVLTTVVTGMLNNRGTPAVMVGEGLVRVW